MSTRAQDVLFCVTTLAASLFLFLRNRRNRRSRGYPLPPRRKGLPLLGNALEMPTQLEWEVYAKWAKELNSDIISLNAAGTSIIIVNSVKIATDLFDTRSTIYSGRPISVMLEELVGWNWAISNLPYGEKWRERRRLFVQHFHPAKTDSHQPRELEHVKRLLQKLLNSPHDYREHVRHLVGGISFSMTYGLPIRQSNDPYINLAEATTHAIASVAVPGAFFVDLIPLLKYVPPWIPGAGFQRKARQWRILNDEMQNKPFDDAERRIAASSAQPSFMSAALDKINPSEDLTHQREVVRDTAAMVFAAGSDTTASAITTFILAMVRHPEVQRRAQKELDEVLGGRLPDFADEPYLPYISAIVKESIRWRVTAPIGVPHLSTEDDIYEGYFIPKNSIIIPNAWAMLHNEAEYPEPHQFKPERFLKNGKIDPTVRDPNTIAFGFGRRICAGAHIAQSLLWLTAASLLAVYDFAKDVDSNGVVIEPSLDYEPGLISHSKPFKCVIKPRSAEAEAIISSLDVFDNV